MADPLSIATACVAAVQTIASVFTTISEFLEGCRTANSDLKGIQDTLTNLQTLFRSIEDEVSGPNTHFIDPTMRSGILNGIHDCTRVIVRINGVVDEHRGHPSKWVRNGKGQVAKLQSSLETYQAVLRLAVSGAKLSLLISVKADTEALRQDVQKLLAECRSQGVADYEPTSSESIITVAVEEIVKSDPSTTKTDNPNEDLSGPSSIDEDETRALISEEITCSRLQALKWDTNLHKTQCVAISFGGEAVAMSSMKEIAVWDLNSSSTTSSRSRVQFDDGLRSWHTPSRLALLCGHDDEVIVAGSSSQSAASSWSSRAFESKFLVHNCTIDKTLYTRVNPRRCIGVALSLLPGEPATLMVVSPSPKRTYSTLLKLQGREAIPTESETQLKDNLELDERSAGFSLQGDYLVAFTKELAAILINTSTGESLGKAYLPQGCTPVIGTPTADGDMAVLILWHGGTKETEICTWDILTGQVRGVKSQRFAHAAAASQRYAVSPDCRLVAVCGSTGAVDVVDAGSGAQLATLYLQDNLPADMGTSKAGLPLTKPNCRGKLMAWSADGGRLVVATRKGAEVWDLRV